MNNLIVKAETWIIAALSHPATNSLILSHYFFSLFQHITVVGGYDGSQIAPISTSIYACLWLIWERQCSGSNAQSSNLSVALHPSVWGKPVLCVQERVKHSQHLAGDTDLGKSWQCILCTLTTHLCLNTRALYLHSSAYNSEVSLEKPSLGYLNSQSLLLLHLICQKRLAKFY